MEAKELRIGNWIGKKYGGNIRVSVDNIKTISTRTYFYPIPLTEEWLEKFGYKEGVLNGFYIDVWAKTIVIDLEQGQALSGILIENINYVHQLQNLYFTITGEELSLL